jgi:hypothetical protein
MTKSIDERLALLDRPRAQEGIETYDDALPSDRRRAIMESSSASPARRASGPSTSDSGSRFLSASTSRAYVAAISPASAVRLTSMRTSSRSR